MNEPFDETPRERMKQRLADPDTNVVWGNDMGTMFVTEDCGGDINITIYGYGGGLQGFASLDRGEYLRLFHYLGDRIMQTGREVTEARD